MSRQLLVIGTILLIAMSGITVLAMAQSETDRSGDEGSGYRPGTPYWVPIIDACMARGGLRSDCIEGLPRDAYRDFLEWERRQAGDRRRTMELRRQSVPAAEALPEIYLDPLDLSDLPAAAAKELSRIGCRIPRSANGSMNVVFGEFAARGQRDVAVICSVGGESTIRVLWGGSQSCEPSEIDGSSDWGLLYKEEVWEYYRAIDVASPEHIRGYYARYPEECPRTDLPVLEHQGIEDMFEGKGSSVRYCHDGRWISLCGVD